MRLWLKSGSVTSPGVSLTVPPCHPARTGQIRAIFDRRNADGSVPSGLRSTLRRPGAVGSPWAVTVLQPDAVASGQTPPAQLRGAQPETGGATVPNCV